MAMVRIVEATRERRLYSLPYADLMPRYRSLNGVTFRRLNKIAKGDY